VSEAAAHEVIVDGALAQDLERLGVHFHAGDRVRLQLVEPLDVPAHAPAVRWDRLESWRELADRKRGPFRPAAGMLADLGPGPDLEDYEEASRLAIEEAGTDSRLPE
jgi:hypothetical protein